MGANADVYVAFGGDTAALEAALARAQSDARKTSAEMRKVADEMRNTGASADSDLGAKLRKLGGNLTGAKTAVSDLRGQMTALAGPATEAGHALEHAAGGLSNMQKMEGVHVIKSIIDSIVAGQSPLKAVAMEGGRIGQIFSMGGIGAAIGPMAAVAAAVAALAAGLGFLGYQAYQASNAVRSIETGAALAGFQQTDEQAAKLRDSIVSLANVSSAEAAEIAKPFLALGPVGVTLAQLASVHIPALAAATGEKLPAAAEKVAKLFIDLDSDGKKWLQTTRTLTNAQSESGLAAIANGDRLTAYAIILQGLSPVLDANAEKEARHKAAIQDSADAMSLASSAGGMVSAAEMNMGNAVAEVTPKLAAQAQTVQDLTAKLRTAASAADTFQTAMAAAMKVDKVASDLKEAEGHLAQIQKGMAGMPDRPTAGMNELARAAKLASDKVAELRQKIDAPGTTDKDLYSQDTEALKQYDNRSREVRTKTLQGQVDMLKGFLATQKLTDEQRLKLTDEMETKQKEIWTAGEKAGAKAAAAGAKDALAASQAGFQNQIKAAEDAEKAKVQLLDDQYKLKKIPESAKVSGTLAALEEEKTAVAALYAQEIALAGNKNAKIVELNGQLTHFMAENAMAVEKANADAAIKSQQAWKSAEGAISGAIDGQVSGVLRGTTSIKTAFADMSASIIQDVIKYAIKWTVEHAGAIAANLTATATGVVAQKTINATAVQGDAGRAAAGAYAATAGIPIIGPVLAPIAAATAYAGTIAVGSYDIGAYQIPHDQLAMVHRNELVMPAPEAGAFRNMLDGAANGAGGSSGGDTHVHLHVTATDDGSVKKLFANNARHIAAALHNAYRRGDHLGLAGVGRI